MACSFASAPVSSSSPSANTCHRRQVQSLPAQRVVLAGAAAPYRPVFESPAYVFALKDLAGPRDRISTVEPPQLNMIITLKYSLNRHVCGGHGGVADGRDLSTQSLTHAGPGSCARPRQACVCLVHARQRQAPSPFPNPQAARALNRWVHGA
eukprot:366283-Chlamydomonas_euryale.AAC.5